MFINTHKVKFETWPEIQDICTEHVRTLKKQNGRNATIE